MGRKRCERLGLNFESEVLGNLLVGYCPLGDKASGFS
jgi:hypothetical protein